MSLSKVQKQIHNLDPKLREVPLLRKIPVVLSDSKAKYLENVVDFNRHPENKIFWWWRKGSDTESQFVWLKNNLTTTFEELGSTHLTLYILLGTCDLTEKNGSYIKLRLNSNDRVLNICAKYRDIYKFVDFPTVNLIFLELPYYSIYQWNLSHKHPDAEPFRADDKLLESQIDLVNKFIFETNIVLHANSPSFDLDLEKVRTRWYNSRAT